MASIFDHLPQPDVGAGYTAQHSRPRILVVDDQPINMKLLERKLEREGMTPLMAENGKRCVEIARAERPDLVLLDIMMPEMDGIEACKALQLSPETRDIPVIFITARSGKEGKIEGLGAGAVDYLVKPIDLDETVARVRTQLRMRDYHRENLRLQRRLSDARKQALVGQLTLGISHNINNLLGIVVGYSDLLRTNPGDPALVRRSLDGMDKGLSRLNTIITQVLRLGEHKRPPLARRSVREILRDALETFRLDSGYAGAASIDLGPAENLTLMTHAETLEVILGRLLANANEAIRRGPASSPEIRIRVTLPDETHLRISIEDNGSGIEPALSENVFAPFISVKTEVGAGLGLPLARHAVELLNGTLTLENLHSGGASATLEFPLISQPAK